MRLLNEKSVEYLLVGGFAVSFHGYPRPTGDLDVWIAIHPENIRKVIEVLQQFGFGGTGLSPDLFTTPRALIRMGVPPVRIELQTQISGVKFEDCYAARIQGDIDGVPVSLISLAHLKQNKRAAARHKDLSDLEKLP